MPIGKLGPSNPGAEKTDRRTRIKMETDAARLADVEDRRITGVTLGSQTFTGRVEFEAGDHLRITATPITGGVKLRFDYLP